jgi:uncharacterized protein YcgL (UPF0745 family)
MVCCIVLKSTKKSQVLIFSRKRQALLSRHIERELSYKPFIFNSSKGAYIFVKKKESFREIEELLISFFSQADLDKIIIYNTSVRPRFFRKLTKQTLNSNDISALGWKGFINSFVIQINPYDPNTSAYSLKIFRRFKKNIKANGSNVQRKFFKRKMKILRKRVSLDSIENLLKLD